MKVIELHQRYGGDSIFINAEKIQTFKSNHHHGKDWQFSVIVTESERVEVRENAAEIILAIATVNNGTYSLSCGTIDEFRKIAPPKYW